MMLEGSAEILAVRVSNLSVTGAAVESEIGPGPGKMISSLEFDLPATHGTSGDFDTIRLDLAAKVARRILVAPREDEDPGYILGVEFQDLVEPVRRMIHRFVFQRMMDAKAAMDSEDSPLRIQRVPYRQSVTLSYDWFGDFETQLTENLSLDGMFIRSSRPYPPGTVFDFQLLLRDDFTLVKGRGEVVWIREREASPDQPAGMGIRFLELDETGRNVIHRVVFHHVEEEAKRVGSSILKTPPTPSLPRQRPQEVNAIPIAIVTEPGIAGLAPSPETSTVDRAPSPTESESAGATAHRDDDADRAVVGSEPVEPEGAAEPDDATPEESRESPAGASPTPSAERPAPPDDSAVGSQPPVPESTVPEPTVPEPTVPEPTVYGSASLRERRRWSWLLISALLLAALAAVFFLRGSLTTLYRSEDPPRPVMQPVAPVAEPASVTEPAPPPAPEPPAPPPDETAAAFVREWATAWSAQSTDEVLGFYSPDFETPANLDHAAWEAFRRERIETPEYIRVEIRDLEVEIGENGLAQVTFFQSYTRNDYADQGVKLLVLAPSAEGWSIIRERSLD